MTRPAKSHTINGDKAQSCELMAGRWLADGNAAEESGKKLTAEKCYRKAQYWLDRANKARGWA